MNVLPSRQEFKAKAGQGNLIPVYTEVYADLETPVSAYLKLRRGANTFLLESVEGGTQVGRYSFLGRDPSVIFEARGHAVRQLESLPETNPDDLGVPDMLFMFTDTIVAFDNVSHKLTVMHNLQARPGDNLDLLYDQAAGVLRQILSDLQNPLAEAQAHDGKA